MLRTHRLSIALLALVAALSFTAVAADARPSGSSGSRGSRTFSTPPPTATAPKGAAPIERSTMQPTTKPTATAAQPGSAVGQAARPGGLFGGGLLGGLAAGFIGAGLFGMLFGHGLAGGLGGFASMFGLLLQIVIVVVVARLIWNWWQRRNQPAYAGAPSSRQALDGGGNRLGLGGLGGFGGFGGGASAGAPASDAPLQTKPEDFDTFERLNREILTAYGNEDLAALRERVTPEMLSYYSEELARNASNGDVNKISDVKLLQGDLAEAWREGQDEYATVAMRYSLKDQMVARDDGRLIEELPSEATEHWTFRRVPGGQWVLSAVQQNS
jgi:predicted lipid-binding transport protein (Tim44 family)